VCSESFSSRSTPDVFTRWRNRAESYGTYQLYTDKREMWIHTLRNRCVRVPTNEGSSQALLIQTRLSDIIPCWRWSIGICAQAVNLINVRHVGDNRMNHLNDTGLPWTFPSTFSTMALPVRTSFSHAPLLESLTTIRSFSSSVYGK
jgi:hypothetical protein